MSESQGFEKQHEIPPQPKVDFESVLEKGEVLSAETLEGFYPMKVVTIKDDGKAIFKPNGFMYERLEKKEGLRTELELLAYSIDKVLGFGLVPPVVSRELPEDGTRGVFQKFIEDAEPAYNYGNNWPEVVAEAEILKAAVFDFLINAQDRHEGNFLVNPDLEKIWLHDHDDLMFVVKGFPSNILTEAIKRNLTELPDEIMKSVQRLNDKVDTLTPSTDPKIGKILSGIKNNAKILLEKGKIPA